MLLYSCTVALSQGWRPGTSYALGFASQKGVDTKGKFQKAFRDRGLVPPRTPAWANAFFGAVFGSVVCGTPGLLMSYPYLGCLRNANCMETMPAINLLLLPGMASVGVVAGATLMVCDRFHAPIPTKVHGEPGDGGAEAEDEAAALLS